MEGVALIDRFSRLVELSDNKMVTVVETEHLGWGESGDAWRWCMPLRAWEEEETRECSVFLNSIIL